MTSLTRRCADGSRHWLPRRACSRSTARLRRRRGEGLHADGRSSSPE